jgi:PAS domain S-box-containing protein
MPLGGSVRKGGMADEQDRTLIEEIARLKATVADLRARRDAGIGEPGDRLGEFARLAVENLSDGTYLISKDARIVYVNEAACQRLGYTRDEMVGMSMLTINPRLTLELWTSVWEVTSRAKKRVIQSEHRTKDGHLVPVEVLANHIEVDGEEYSCAFTRDITDRLEMEKRLRQSEKMEAIGQLAGGIAHDFNNQLSGIVGGADILRQELRGQPRLAGLAQAILSAAKRSADLTQKLLAFARQGKYLAAPVDLHQIIEEVAQLLSRSIDKRIRIVTALEADPAFALGDPSQIENAILNLALNARDAMPVGGTLTFSTKIVDLDEAWCARSQFPVEPGRYVRVKVADTGVGISEEMQAHIFEPFFTTKEQGKGTGMGLAAVYGTVTNHDGAIEVVSRMGEGTEMKLYLPLATAPEPAPASVGALPSAGDFDASVLLVEDEDVVREVASEMLERLGCRVTTARDGKEAVALFGHCPNDFDVVVLDVVMPELSGRDTFAQLRALNPTIAAILASGYSLDGEVQGILDLGAAAFIQKPFRMAELEKVLSDVLGARPKAAKE